MIRFLSFCALSAIVMAVLTTVRADTKKDIEVLNEFIETVKNKRQDIWKFVEISGQHCMSQLKPSPESGCLSRGVMVEKAFIDPYNKAYSFIEGYMNKLKSNPVGFEHFKPKEIIQQAMARVVAEMKTGFTELQLRDVEANRDNLPHLKIFAYWVESTAVQFLKDANKLHKKYTSWTLRR